MNLPEKVATGVDGLKQFAKLERVLAAILVLTPLLLLTVDTGPETVRDSVSAYHDVIRPEAFYFPLTVAAMLFVVNGVLKDGHAYNWVLGVLLALVIVFDHDGSSRWLHYVGAIGFFGGNFVAMIWFSTKKSKPLVVVLAGSILLSLALWITYSLFWAEWVSLAIVSLHYILDSVKWAPYTAWTKTGSPEASR